MKKEAYGGEQGGFIMKVAMVVVALCIVFIVFASLSKSIAPQLSGTSAGSSAISGNNGGNNQLLSFLNGPSGSGSSVYGGADRSDIPASSRSPYAGKISLSSGNAAYSAQPFEEYVTLQNNGGSAIAVTGWTLTNGKATRPLQNTGNNYFYAPSDSATIGEGTEFLDPSGVFRTGPIILRPGDGAIVTTGRPFSQFPFSISTSFRENICEGYLRNYPFEPALDQSCPAPTDDPDTRVVTTECYDYLQSLNRCEDPAKYDKANFEMTTSQCQSFMTARFSYPMCVARHGNDHGFSLGQWRIFLGKGAQLWADRKETITLYDSQGLIVDQISY